MSLEKAFNKAWYGNSGWTYIFYPLTLLVRHLVNKKRKNFLASKQAKNTSLNSSPQVSVPVIVVGNISVGGTGKSPMVIALAKYLKESGYTPGIVSRGYGVEAVSPILVSSETSATIGGDEPVMLAYRTECPVVICQKRLMAAESLLEMHPEVDVIISDDGMQHYALDRDIEILMLDGKRGVGNGQLLPVGPLREPVERIKSVDLIASLVPSQNDVPLAEQQITNIISSSKDKNIPSSFVMPLLAKSLINVATNEETSLEFLKQQNPWYIVAGIGNPQRFLNTLLLNGITEYDTHWFNDHHNFSKADFPDQAHVIMTEKDAVKCRELKLNNPNLWYLSIAIDLPEVFKQQLTAKLDSAVKNKK